MIFVNLNWNNISRKSIYIEKLLPDWKTIQVLEWEIFTWMEEIYKYLKINGMNIKSFVFLSKLWNSCDMKLGLICIWLLLLLVFWYFRDIRLGWSDMREISTEEFRKLSADKKAQTLSINTLAYKQGHSYTDKVLKSNDKISACSVGICGDHKNNQLSSYGTSCTAMIFHWNIMVCKIGFSSHVYFAYLPIIDLQNKSFSGNRAFHSSAGKQLAPAGNRRKPQWKVI